MSSSQQGLSKNHSLSRLRPGLPRGGSPGFPRLPKSKPSASGFDLDKEEGADGYAAWGKAASGMKSASSDVAVTEGVLTQWDLAEVLYRAAKPRCVLSRAGTYPATAATPSVSLRLTAPSGREPRRAWCLVPRAGNLLVTAPIPQSASAFFALSSRWLSSSGPKL